MKSITLTFPWPDMQLASIHGNGNRFLKARQIKTLRTIAAGESINQAGDMRFKTASVNYWLYIPNKIKRDAANMVQACKPIIDGIVDSKVLSGDSWDVLRISGVFIDVDRDNPRVEIHLFEETR